MTYFATLNSVIKIKGAKPVRWFYVRAHVGSVQAMIFRYSARSREEAMATLKYFQGAHRFHPQMKFTVCKTASNG